MVSVADFDLDVYVGVAHAETRQLPKTESSVLPGKLTRPYLQGARTNSQFRNSSGVPSILA
jgi:hypothetical protein